MRVALQSKQRGLRQELKPELFIKTNTQVNITYAR